jgi:glycosyltransferase involved in cell wall biosynthesis
MNSIVAIDARSIGRAHTGDATYWTGLVSGLAELDTNLRLLLFSNGPKPPGIPDHLEWIEIPSRRERWWSLVRFPLKARRMGARVIHTQYNLSPLSGRGGVTTIHDVSFFVGPEWFRPVDRMLLQRFVPRSARRAARVLTVSEASRRDIAKFMPDIQEKVRVTPLALNPRMQPVPPEEADRIVTDELGLQRPFLLTVGTSWPRKNTRLAVEACDLLPENLGPLAVTGKSGWGDHAPSSRAIRLGYVEDRQLSALYQSASLYLAPALYEGFGLTLLEAFAGGCPVLCSDIAAHREVAGDAAEFASGWTPSEWAEQIQRTLEDSSKLDALRERGRERLIGFSWAQTARLTEAVYREILD